MILILDAGADILCSDARPVWCQHLTMWSSQLHGVLPDPASVHAYPQLLWDA